MSDTREPAEPALLQTGVEGLDDVLLGGLAPRHLYLVEGDPGSGKTTLALQFLNEGAARGERCLFVTLSESEAELRASAVSHGWDLKGIDVIEVVASEHSLEPDSRYTMYHPSEVELGATIRRVFDEVAVRKPQRMVFDSLSELRLLADSTLRYRRQILAMKHLFTRQGTTVLLVDDLTGAELGDKHLHSLAHGVISLGRELPVYGTMRRRLQVSKMRGRAFREGVHDLAIRRGGVRVFPRLVAAEHDSEYDAVALRSGIAPLDSLLGGGLTRGTSTLIIGAAGTGKSTLAAQFAREFAHRGERSDLFLFDEAIGTFVQRCAGLSIDLRAPMDSGLTHLRQVDPAELSPGEFAHAVRATVEREGTRLVVIDSLNGYMNAMPSDRFLTLHLHELLSFLGRLGVTTILLATQHGIIGERTGPTVDASYLADTVLLLRYFEAFGEVRQAVSVIKKRTGAHERTVRELRFGPGIEVGAPLRDFQGVLTGVPSFVGTERSALAGAERR